VVLGVAGRPLAKMLEAAVQASLLSRASPPPAWCINGGERIETSYSAAQPSSVQQNAATPGDARDPSRRSVCAISVLFFSGIGVAGQQRAAGSLRCAVLALTSRAAHTEPRPRKAETGRSNDAQRLRQPLVRRFRRRTHVCCAVGEQERFDISCRAEASHTWCGRRLKPSARTRVCPRSVG
jgi:hypothetical protein